MILRIPHVNDRTAKYSSMALLRRQHEYLELPGEYETRYPTEVVFPHMDNGRMDDLYSVKEGMLINLEEETMDVSEKTLRKIARYRVFGDFVYSKYVYSAIICHKDPKNYPKEFKLTDTDILRPHYIYFPQETLWKKYENLIRKIEQKEQLSEREILDIAFVPKFISNEDAPFVTESLCLRFKEVEIDDKLLRIDVGCILGAMVLKNIDSETKQIKLLEKIGMKRIKNDLRILVRDEFGDELSEVEEENFKLKQEMNQQKQEIKQQKQEINQQKQEINQQKQEINQQKQKMKSAIEKLNKMEDLNTPQARELLNTVLMIMR